MVSFNKLINENGMLNYFKQLLRFFEINAIMKKTRMKKKIRTQVTIIDKNTSVYFLNY